MAPNRPLEWPWSTPAPEPSDSKDIRPSRASRSRCTESMPNGVAEPRIVSVRWRRHDLLAAAAIRRHCRFSPSLPLPQTLSSHLSSLHLASPLSRLLCHLLCRVPLPSSYSLGWRNKAGCSSSPHSQRSLFISTSSVSVLLFSSSDPACSFLLRQSCCICCSLLTCA